MHSLAAPRPCWQLALSIRSAVNLHKCCYGFYPFAYPHDALRPAETSRNRSSVHYYPSSSNSANPVIIIPFYDSLSSPFSYHWFLCSSSPQLPPTSFFPGSSSSFIHDSLTQFCSSSGLQSVLNFTEWPQRPYKDWGFMACSNLQIYRVALSLVWWTLNLA